MLRKIINSILVVLITASMVWAVAPKYKIGQDSDMTSPPNIGVTTPGTGRFDTLKVTGASLSTSAGTGFYSLGTASFLGDITITSNATTRATGPFIISGAFNYTGATQGTAENIVIGTNAPNIGKFTDLTATNFIATSSTIQNFIATTSSATNFIATTSSIQNLNIGTNLTAGGLPGTSGQLLKSGGAGSLPTWTSSPTFVTTTHDSAYVTNFNARTVYTEKGVATAGALYGFIAGGQSSFIPAGASGLVLTATGASSLPTWQAAAGGASSNITYGFTSVEHSSLGPSTTVASPGAWADEITITPQSSSNKVYINISAALYGDANTNCGLLLRRSVSGVYTDLVSNARTIAGQAAGMGGWASISHLDSPSTTNQIKYSLWVFKLSGSNSCSISPGGTDYTILSVAEVAP